MIALRPYQEAAVAAVRDAEDRGVRRQMVVMPTGAGKTVVFGRLIADRGGNALVLAHREELLDQAAQKIRMVMPGAAVGIVQAGRNDWWAPVVVASVPTVRTGKRLQQIASRPYSIVVTDEAHHSAAKSYRNVYEALGVGEDGGPLLVGVTATPDRGDGKGLDDLFDEIVYQVGIEELVTDGYLCDIRAKRVMLAIDLDTVKRTGGDFSESALQDAMVAADQPWHTARAVIDHAADRKSIVFVAGVELAHETAAEISSLGLPTEVVHGEMLPLDRRAVLARLKSGMTRCVVNCMVLTEGFDEPTVDCVVIARPTASRSLYQQMAGRGLRTSPGKADCLIIDVVGVTKRHDLQTVATLAGRPIGDGSSLLGAIRAGAPEDEAEQETFLEGQLVTEDVDVFRRSRLRWRDIKRNGAVAAWSIQPDTESRIFVVPGNGDSYSVVRHYRDGDRLEVVAKDLDQGYAQGVAEDIARKGGARALIERDASWRSSTQISEKQAALALRFGILQPSEQVPWSPGVFLRDGREITRGEVSDQLDDLFASWQYQKVARVIGAKP